MVTCALDGCKKRFRKDKRGVKKYCQAKCRQRANSKRRVERIKELRKTDPEFRDKMRAYQNQYMKKYLKIPANYERHKKYVNNYQRRRREQERSERNE